MLKTESLVTRSLAHSLSLASCRDKISQAIVRMCEGFGQDYFHGNRYIENYHVAASVTAVFVPIVIALHLCKVTRVVYPEYDSIH
jgi:hypothetical protein